MTDDQRDMCKRFLKHAKSLVLDWCECQEDVVVDMLTSVECVSQAVQDIRFLSKGRFFGCKKRAGNNESDKKTITEAVITFLEFCKNVRKIDFGTNAALCHNEDIMDVLEAKSDGGKLADVNMSGIYPSFALMIIPRGRINRRISLIKDSLFKTVTEITVDWDNHFEDLITTLATSPSSVKTLGLLIEPEEFWDYINPKTPLTQLWKLLKSNKPGIEVKLNLNELPYYKDADLDDIRAVFNQEMPLTKLCVVYKSEEFAKIVLRNIKKEKHASSLKEIGFHHISVIHWDTVPIKEVWNISKLIPDLKCLKDIRKISWSGEFVLITDLLALVTQHIATLQELHIHKHEVVSGKDLAQEEEEEKQMKKRKKKTKYYDPLTDAEICCVEKTVSKILRKPWSMLSEIPIQRYPINNRLGFNSCDELPDREMFYVLQNKVL